MANLVSKERKTVPESTKRTEAIPGFQEALEKETGKQINKNFGQIVGKMIDTEISSKPAIDLIIFQLFISISLSFGTLVLFAILFLISQNMNLSLFFSGFIMFVFCGLYLKGML